MLLDIQFEFGASTLRRLKTKTRELLRNVSKHYSNVTNRAYGDENTKDPNKPSQPSTFRSELKRHLSNVSLRRSSGSFRRHNSEPKWKWARKASRTDQLDGNFTSHNNSPFKAVYHTVGHRNGNHMDKTLSDLFESPDFESRISEGLVSGRKSYQERGSSSHEEDEYHISYRENYPTNNNTAEHSEQQPSSNDHNYHLFPLQEKILYFKDQTIQKSKSIQLLTRYFSQEL